MSKKVYEVVTNKIIKLIEESEELVWRKPWNTVIGKGTPINYVTKKGYSGFNYVALTTIANAFGKPNVWLTFNQAKKAGIKVNKGAESIPLIYWNFKETEKETTEIDENGNEITKTKKVKYPFCRYFRVFNIADTDAEYEEETKEEEETELNFDEVSENTIKDYLKREAELTFNATKSNSAYYNPRRDEVVVPELSQYEAEDEYYSTVFHELVHSTGHKSRLNRLNDGENMFGSKTYSKEELVAEIGASILCNIHGFENTMDNSVAYIKGWLKKIKEEPHVLISACTRAYKAVDMIKG